MLKISESKILDRAAMLKLEGRVVGPWVAELKGACQGCLAQNRAITLDLADVSFADRSGIALLLDLRSQGVAFLNCSPFLEEELRAMPFEPPR